MEADEAIASGSSERPDESLSLLNLLSAMQKSMSETNKLLTELKEDKGASASSHATMFSQQSNSASDEADTTPASEEARPPASEEAHAHGSDEATHRSNEESVALAGHHKASKDDALSIFGGNEYDNVQG